MLVSKKWKIRLLTVKHNTLLAIFNHRGELLVSQIIWWHLQKFILMSVHKYWFTAFEMAFKWYNQTEVSDRHGNMWTERKMLSLKDNMSRCETKPVLPRYPITIWSTNCDLTQTEVLLNWIYIKWGYTLELALLERGGEDMGGRRERR